MKKVVLITCRNILPLNGGDKLVHYHLAAKLHAKCKLTLINVIDEEGYTPAERSQLEHITDELVIIPERFYPSFLSIIITVFTFLPYLVARRSRRATVSKKINAIVASIEPDIIIYDQVRSTSYIHHKLDDRGIIVEHNDEVFIYKEKGSGKFFLHRWFIHFQSYLLNRWTSRVHSAAKKVVFLSASDIRYPAANKVALTHLTIRLSNPLVTVSESKNINLLFVGALDWYPNLEGITWFILNVMPLLPAEFRLNVVGRKAPESLLKLQNERVVVHANVPSTEPYFMQSDIFISPVFKGSGINIKMFEAASYGIPIVASQHSIRGYPALNFLPIAGDAQSFCNSLLQYADAAVRFALQKKIIDWYQAYLVDAEAEVETIFLN